MPRYEIVAHFTKDVECDTAEEAAAIIRRQQTEESGVTDSLLHLAIWNQDPTPASSTLPPYLRQQLVDFFAGLERRVGEGGNAFRDRVTVVSAVSAEAREDA